MEHLMSRYEKTEAEWKEVLTAEQFQILREKGTERAWTGHYNDYKGNGIFYCAGCGTPLFDAKTKFDSGSGWPSFSDKINSAAVLEHRDVRHGMVREEVTCAACDGHLGHVFPDGPKPTGLRYCINSIAIVAEDEIEK